MSNFYKNQYSFLNIYFGWFNSSRTFTLWLPKTIYFALKIWTFYAPRTDMTHSHLCNSDKSSKALGLRSWAAWRLVGYGWNFARLVLGLISIFQKISIYGSWGRLFHRIKKTSFIYRSQIHQATFLNIFNKLTIVLLEICNVLTPLLAYILSWKLKNKLKTKDTCWASSLVGDITIALKPHFFGSWNDYYH